MLAQPILGLILVAIGLAVVVGMVTGADTKAQTGERMKFQLMAFHRYTLLLDGTPVWKWRGNTAPVQAMVGGTYRDCVLVVTDGFPKVVLAGTDIEADLRGAVTQRSVSLYA